MIFVGKKISTNGMFVYARPYKLAIRLSALFILQVVTTGQPEIGKNVSGLSDTLFGLYILNKTEDNLCVCVCVKKQRKRN